MYVYGENPRICIITYDHPHRKTQDLLTKLILNGYSNLHLTATPWVSKKDYRPLYTHRPVSCVDITMEQLADRLNIGFSRANVTELGDHFWDDYILRGVPFDHILIGGAGILPEEAVSHRVINSHPGYLPNVRGLDAYKWAIYLGQPIGVTTHHISERPDEGSLIERRCVPVYFEDTFHSVAQRVYELEIDMLVNSISIENSTELESLEDPRYTACKRMSPHCELVMMERFENIRRNAPSRYGEN